MIIKTLLLWIIILRIKELKYASLSKFQRQVYDDICKGPRGKVMGPLSIWLQRPQLADYAQNLGQYCRYETSLPRRLSELAILVTAKIWDADYEWNAHVGYASEAGISPIIIGALENKDYPSFLKEDEDIMDFHDRFMSAKDIAKRVIKGQFAKIY